MSTPSSPGDTPDDGFKISPGPPATLRGRAGALLALGSSLGIGTCGFAEGIADSTLEYMVFSTFGVQLFLGFAALAGAALTLESTSSRLGLGRSRLPWSLVLLAAFGTLGLSHAIDNVLSFGGLRDESVLAELDAHLRGAGGKALLLSIIGLGIAPGVCEELLCRGLLQRGLVRHYGAPVAIGISALVFGAMHLEWIQGSAAALLGLYLGTVAYRAGSIRPAIFCHCCNNLTALALGVSGRESDPSFTSAALGFAIAALALGALLFNRRTG